ncbi:MAG: hypothetical protein R3189_07610 [Thiomicrorhabdus chilensis]|uniref:hypothetical protein n=1 Tax=Thiomicrorhabdus chilensis TaxID=63656 RepID=UPI00299D163B|nr:hypothetical protein [Thiomicrorhabdus chilensis]MDX1348101.1 hypothetical protein [Thiomicrorhabdus chilensis]
MYDSRHVRMNKALLLTILLMGVVFSGLVYAQADHDVWQLYSLDENQQFDPDRPELQNNLQKVGGISLVGGHYLYSGEVHIDQDGSYVVDFKNTSAIDRFSF